MDSTKTRLRQWHDGREKPGMAQKNRVTVKIASTEYTINGEESPEYIQRVASSVDRTVRDIMRADPSLSLTETAMLSALNLCDEAMRQHRAAESQARKAAELEKKLEAAMGEGEALRSEIQAARENLVRIKQELIRVEAENRSLREQAEPENLD